jgi:hypothetical protein
MRDRPGHGVQGDALGEIGLTSLLGQYIVDDAEHLRRDLVDYPVTVGLIGGALLCGLLLLPLFLGDAGALGLRSFLCPALCLLLCALGRGDALLSLALGLLTGFLGGALLPLPGEPLLLLPALLGFLSLLLALLLGLALPLLLVDLGQPRLGLRELAVLLLALLRPRQLLP